MLCQRTGHGFEINIQPLSSSTNVSYSALKSNLLCSPVDMQCITQCDSQRLIRRHAFSWLYLYPLSAYWHLLVCTLQITVSFWLFKSTNEMLSQIWLYPPSPTPLASSFSERSLLPFRIESTCYCCLSGCFYFLISITEQCLLPWS